MKFNKTIFFIRKFGVYEFTKKHDCFEETWIWEKDSDKKILLKLNVYNVFNCSTWTVSSNSQYPSGR